jgi:hypothetical protein
VAPFIKIFIYILDPFAPNAEHLVDKGSRMRPGIAEAHCETLTLGIAASVVETANDLIRSTLWYANIKRERPCRGSSAHPIGCRCCKLTKLRPGIERV